MNLVIQNPYRNLGVVNPITNKELIKKESNIKMSLEFNKPIDSYTDLANILPLNRDLETIQDAMRQLENDEDRLFHSLFWFFQLDGFDADILGSINKSNLNELINKLENQLKQNPNTKFSSLINLNILYFIKLHNDRFDNAIINKVIKNYGHILNYKIEEIKASIVPNNLTSIDNNKVNQKVVESLIKYVQEYSNKTNSLATLNIFDSFNKYPKDSIKNLESMILNPVIQKIEDAINFSCKLIEQNNSSQLHKKNGLIELESLIRELSKYKDNYKIKNAINDYVEAAIACAKFALDQVNDEKTAISIINWAITLPAYGQTQDNQQHAKKQIENSIESKKFDQLYSNIVAQLEKPITSVADADYRVEVYKVELRKITHKDNDYYEVSSACVRTILNFIHGKFVETCNIFKLDRNKVDFSNQISQLLNIVNKLDNFDMNFESRQMINETLSSLREIQSNIQTPVTPTRPILNSTGQASSESKNKAGMVTALIFIAILIMIGVIVSNNNKNTYTPPVAQTSASSPESQFPTAETATVQQDNNVPNVDTSTTLYCPVYNTKGGGYVQLRLSCDSRNCITDDSTLGDRINDYSIVQVYPNYTINSQGNGITIDFVKLADRDDTWISSTRLIRDQCSSEPIQTTNNNSSSEESTSDTAQVTANSVADSAAEAAAQVAEAAANIANGSNSTSSYTCPVYNTKGGGYVQLRKHCDTSNCITDDSTLGSQIDDYDLVKVDPNVVVNNEGNGQTINFVKLADREDTWISETRIIASKCVKSN